MNIKEKKKILLVFGTRPEAIKMAPLVLAFKKFQNDFEVEICVTGQHRQMMDQVLTLFGIVPDYDLNIMHVGQDLYDITARVLLGMREILKRNKPDIILVHGDTSTSTATALAAYYQQIPVGHVEAGLRTRNIYSPWPEEINRQITGRIAEYHFAPTHMSEANLLQENVQREKIFVTGNTVIDALFSVLEKISDQPELKNSLLTYLTKAGLPGNKISAWEKCRNNTHSKGKLVLITGHRRENFGQGFLDICSSIKNLSEKFPDVDFVYPMHLNPNVRKAITEIFGSIADINVLSGNIHFIEPLDYLPFIYLMSISYIVLTDSGGIQEEAPSLGKPVLVMRNTTERPEALASGGVKLVGTNKETIINLVSELILEAEMYKKMSNSINPYGDGKACDRIVEILLKN